jgi:hypothetical protein
MRLVAEHSRYVLLLQRGRLVAQGATRQVFARPELLAQASTAPPPVTRLSQALRPYGMRGHSLTVEGFYREFATLASTSGGGN